MKYLKTLRKKEFRECSVLLYAFPTLTSLSLSLSFISLLSFPIPKLSAINRSLLLCYFIQTTDEIISEIFSSSPFDDCNHYLMSAIINVTSPLSHAFSCTNNGIKRWQRTTRLEKFTNGLRGTLRWQRKRMKESEAGEREARTYSEREKITCKQCVKGKSRQPKKN